MHRGGYVLIDAESGSPDVVLIGTGSEVQLAVAARTQLAEKDISARVVSMPCREWFDAQDKAYRDTVIPPIVKARVSVEAGVAMGWRDIVGDHGRSVSLEHFGASADSATIYREFGITAGRRRPRRGGQPPLHPEGHPLRKDQPCPNDLQNLSDAGVSIWLDDLSRERLETGNLADLVRRSRSSA